MRTVVLEHQGRGSRDEWLRGWQEREGKVLTLQYWV